MCGICGIIGAPAPRLRSKREENVRRMLAQLEHRGPDGEGLAASDWFCLGHRRLAIIDLTGGAQPMWMPDGSATIVFNGEIYNYRELHADMAAHGHTFSTESDTEVLLRALSETGTQTLSALNGMFAFAWLEKNTGRWLLARDPFGIKPLYYTYVGDDLVFASEIKALLALPEITARLDPAALQHYLTFQFCLGGQTMFSDIKQLHPGHYMTGVFNKPAQPTCYWDTNYHIDFHHTPEYFEERLKTLLDDSARLQVRSDVPVGAYLSGGLDSSLVAATASRHLGRAIPVFHGRFNEGPAYDESAHARTVARHIGASYHEVAPTAEDFVQFLPRLIHALDEPLAGPGLFPQYMVSRLASQHVKVVLGGQGGDEIFGGYARYLIGYLEQALKGAIYETQEEGRHIVSLSSIIPNLPLLQQYQPLMQQLFREGMFGDMDRRYFRLIDRSPNLDKLLSADLLANFNRDQIFADFQKIFNHPDTGSYLNKMTHFDQKTLLPALLQIEDRMSMAVSIESRVPLLDTRIVDLITTMPPPMKFHGGRTKHTLKTGAQDLLPRSITERKDKMGFPVPLAEWSKKGIVRDFIADILTSQASLERGIFSRKALCNLTNENSPGFRQLWGILCIELWHRIYIDRTLTF